MQIQDLLLLEINRVQLAVDRIEHKLRWMLATSLLAVSGIVFLLSFLNIFHGWGHRDLELANGYLITAMLCFIAAGSVGFIALLNPIRKPNNAQNNRQPRTWFHYPDPVAGTIDQRHAYHSMLSAQTVAHADRPWTVWEKHLADQIVVLNARHARMQRLNNTMLWFALAALGTPIVAIVYLLYCVGRMEFKR